MPNKRKSSRKLKRLQRRARHNQNKKEGTVMTENIMDTENEKTKIPTEDAEGKNAPDEACAITEGISNETTGYGTAEDGGLSEKEETTMDNKPENVNVKKETSHKLYIQYNDLEFSDELMFEAAVIAYCNEYNQDKSSVESVNLYVKPQEGKAYYVINNDAEKTGSIDL